MASEARVMTRSSDHSGHQLLLSPRNMTMHKVREHVKSEPVTTLLSLSTPAAATTAAAKSVDDVHHHHQQQPIYEDIDTMNPLKIAPVSGVFQPVNGKSNGVIKPLALKATLQMDQSSIASPSPRTMSGSSNNNNNNNSDLIMNQNYSSDRSSSRNMHAQCTAVSSETPAFASSLTRSSVSPFSTSTASYDTNPVPPPRRPVRGEHVSSLHSQQSVSGPMIQIHSSTPKSYLSQSQYSLSQSSYFVEDDAWYSGLFLNNRMQTTTPVFNSKPHSRKVRRSSTFNSDDLAVQTPSPSDSGIGELEALVREKDSEISFLRETLEQNEQVIFKVYEEKEQTWQKEYMKLRTQYESSLLVYQKKALKAEEQLLLLTQQAKEEKVRSEKEVQDLRNSNQFLEKKIAEMNLQIDVLRDRVTESEWNLCQKRESLLHQEQHQHEHEPECNPMHANSGRDSSEQESGSRRRDEERLLDQLETTIHMLRDQVQDLLHQRKSSESLVTSLRQENEDLRYQLGNVREELNTTREGMDEERDQWQQEKQKVLRYQKHLNQNYILLLKRNKEIESDLKALRDKTSYKIITDSETKC